MCDDYQQPKQAAGGFKAKNKGSQRGEPKTAKKKNLILFAVAAAAAMGSISNRLRCRVALTLNFCKFIRALYDPPLWLCPLLPTLRSFVAVTFGNFHYFMSSSLSSSPSPSSSAHHRRQRQRRRSQSKFYTPLFAAKQKLNKI